MFYFKNLKKTNIYSHFEMIFSLYDLTGKDENCLKLRRSSDDAESDFGYVDDYIDKASILTWAGSDTIYVKEE